MEVGSLILERRIEIRVKGMLQSQDNDEKIDQLFCEDSFLA